MTSDRETVERLAEQYLPDEHRAAWLDLLRPAVRLVPAADGEPVVASLGGMPDLPDHVAWPEWDGHGPLTFVGEIDCAALVGFEVDITLPEAGRLLLFYFDGSVDEGAAVVGTWDPPSLAGARLVHVREPGTPPVGARALTGVPVVTYPNYEHPALFARFGAGAGAAHDAWMAHPINDDDFNEALWDRHEGAAHQVGGYAAPVQGPVESEVAHAALGNPDWSDPRLAVEADRWRLVVQIDSDDDVMWGDAGALYWLARPDDLARGDLSQVSFTWQCG